MCCAVHRAVQLNDNQGGNLTMNKNRLFAVITVLVLCAAMLAGCGKSEFGLSENTDKLMTINAENAAKDSYFMVGSLEVGEGEQINITGDLEKGTVKVEIVAGPSESIEEVPDTEAEAIITANISGADGASGTVEPGSYMLRATCTEKATGTVVVEVTPAQ